MTISLVLVDDHVLVRGALGHALERIDGLHFVGFAGTPEEAVAQLARWRPDVALVDLRLGPRSALDHLGELRAASPRTRLLVLTGWPSTTGLERALAGGACGLVSKGRSIDDLVAAVRQVHAGQVVVDPTLVAGLVRDVVGGGRDQPAPRDLEVLELLAEGRDTAAIARTLHLSEDAVRNRVRGCLAKLGVHSRVDAVREATDRGWLLPPEPAAATPGVRS
jgi:two-component system, NarL family, response regulator DesR